MATTNESITFKGEPAGVKGHQISVGDVVPDFTLTANDLSDTGINAFQGKIVIICSVPSLDTPVCSVEMKRFNEEVTKLSDEIAILAVSADLPFAQARWCGQEGVDKVVTASDYKHRNFGDAFWPERFL